MFEQMWLQHLFWPIVVLVVIVLLTLFVLVVVFRCLADDGNPGPASKQEGDRDRTGGSGGLRSGEELPVETNIAQRVYRLCHKARGSQGAI